MQADKPPQTDAHDEPLPAANGLREFSPHSVNMLRTSQVNTMMLSQMADQKASILMGATFLVFSIAVTRSLAGDMPWSLAILAIFAFLSSLLAVIAIIPTVKPPPPGTRPNLMFFGHFSGREEEEWVADVLDELETDETVYRAMLHDIYQNGQVLQKRKFRYLSYAYQMFVVGLMLTLISFGIELAITY